MTNDALIALISSLSAVLLTSLLSIFQIYINRNIKNIQSTNLIIYHLLEIRFSLMESYRIDSFIDLYLDKILTSDDQFFKENIVVLNQISDLLIKLTKNQNSENIVKGYNKAISKFAAIDPISSYTISSFGDIFEIFQRLEVYHTKFFELANGTFSNEDKSKFSELAKNSKEIVLKEKIREIEFALLKNQNGILFKEKIKMYLLIRKTKIKSKSELIKDFNQFLETHFPKINFSF